MMQGDVDVGEEKGRFKHFHGHRSLSHFFTLLMAGGAIGVGGLGPWCLVGQLTSNTWLERLFDTIFSCDEKVTR